MKPFLQLIIEDLRTDNITSDPSGEGAAGDVLVVVLDQDAVVPW